MVDCGLFATRAGSSTFLFIFEIELSTLRVVNYDRVCLFFSAVLHPVVALPAPLALFLRNSWLIFISYFHNYQKKFSLISVLFMPLPSFSPAQLAQMSREALNDYREKRKAKAFRRVVLSDNVSLKLYFAFV